MITKKSNNKKAIILLSSGLDSLVSLGCLKDEYDIMLAITFDYGQKAKEQEIIHSKKTAEYYGINHKVIDLDWIKEFSNSTLVNTNDVPEITLEDLSDRKTTENSAKNVWVGNRNAVFISIAASIAESLDYKYIIIGANKEEGKTFPDNSKKFIKEMNKLLLFSTIKKPQVLTPLINFDKNKIIKEALKRKVPLEMLYSCYKGGEKHCGTCESCLRLKKALSLNGVNNLTKFLF